MTILFAAYGDSDDGASGATTIAATGAAETGETESTAVDAPTGASGRTTFATADLTIDGPIVSCSSSGEKRRQPHRGI